MSTIREIDVSEAQSRYEDRAPQAAGLFAQRAAASANRWRQNAENSQDAYEEAMRNSDVLQRRLDNIDSDAENKYQQNIQQVGESRYSQGVRNGGGRWRQNFEPIAQALSGADITDRGPTMSEANFQRVREVAEIANRASQRS